MMLGKFGVMDWRPGLDAHGAAESPAHHRYPGAENAFSCAIRKTIICQDKLGTHTQGKPNKLVTCPVWWTGDWVDLMGSVNTMVDGRGKRSFLRHFIVKDPNICQDRLGTNVNMGRFDIKTLLLQVASTGSNRTCIPTAVVIIATRVVISSAGWRTVPLVQSCGCTETIPAHGRMMMTSRRTCGAT